MVDKDYKQDAELCVLCLCQKGWAAFIVLQSIRCRTDKISSIQKKATCFRVEQPRLFQLPT
ncbi:MAG: hypothetical protein D3910_16710 [Candidatus Electrothrix sp. ATG2]|nr:hypothetical protein [Candidatus Electrothrix sp. ATG2]